MSTTFPLSSQRSLQRAMIVCPHSLLRPGGVYVYVSICWPAILSATTQWYTSPSIITPGRTMSDNLSLAWTGIDMLLFMIFSAISSFYIHRILGYYQMRKMLCYSEWIRPGSQCFMATHRNVAMGYRSDNEWSAIYTCIS